MKDIIFKCLLLLLVIFNISFGNIMIFLNNNAIVKDDIKLQDIGKFAGTNIPAQVKKLNVKPILNGNYISKSQLEFYIERLYPSLDIKIYGPEKVNILFAKFFLSNFRIKDEIKKFLIKKLKLPENQIKFRIRKYPQNKFFLFKPDSIVVFSKKIKINNFNLFSLELYKGGRVVERINVPLHLKVYKYYYTPKHLIYNNTVVKTSDFEKKLFLASVNEKGIVLDIGNIIGSKTTRILKPGNILYNRYFKWPVLVKRNDIIDVIVKTGNVKITCKLKALEDGHKNEYIKAKNIKSNKVLQVKIVDKNKGEIIL